MAFGFRLKKWPRWPLNAPARTPAERWHVVLVFWTRCQAYCPSFTLGYWHPHSGFMKHPGEDALHLIEQGRPGAYLSWDAYHAYRRDVERQQLSVT